MKTTDIKKLELKHIAPYLSYELKVQCIDDKDTGVIVGTDMTNIIKVI